MPLLAPVYFVFAHWFCRKYDAEFTKEDPKGWPSEKKEILKNHRNILIGWIIFMVWGYFSDWGGDDLPYKYTQPSETWKESIGACIGHSVGEIIGMYCASSLNLHDCVTILVKLIIVVYH